MMIDCQFISRLSMGILPVEIHFSELFVEVGTHADDVHEDLIGQGVSAYYSLVQDGNVI